MTRQQGCHNLLQVGKKHVAGKFLVDGDIGCHHSGAKRLIPWRGLDGPAQAKPIISRETVNGVEIVDASESPGMGAPVEDAPHDGDARPVKIPGARGQ